MKPHEEWLFKAENDLKSSQLLASAEQPLLDIAIYHTQQCAEKSLKCILAYHGKDIPRTHDLRILLDLCTELDPELENMFDDCIFLSPFATLYRYPEGSLMPSPLETASAIQAAERVLTRIRAVISG